MAAGLGFLDLTGGLLADGIPLAVHFVVGDLVLLHRAEGAQAHMERHLGDAHPFGPDGVHQLGREVEARRGRGGAAQLLGVHRLVLALVLQLFGDVGRQGHFAEGVQLFIEGLGVIAERDQLVAVLHRLVHGGGQGAVAEGDDVARVHPLAGLGQALPLVPFHLPQQQQFADGAGGLLDAHDPGRKDLGIVHHQQVPRHKIFREVVEDAVFYRIAVAVQHHQPGRVAGAGRFLCNQLFGEIVPKIFFQHGMYSPFQWVDTGAVSMLL